MVQWTNLEQHVEIAFGAAGAPQDWTWTDVTPDLLGGTPIQITRGRQDEQSSVQPSECRLVLRDQYGHYMPGNPRSPHYPHVELGAPVRVRLLGQGDGYLLLDGTTGSYASSPDAAAWDITGDLDIRLDVTAEIPTARFLLSKWDQDLSWHVLLLSNGNVQFAWTTDGTSGTQQTRVSTAAAPIGQRVAIRVTLDVDNGSGGHTVAFYTADTIAGPWTPLGTPLTQPGTISVHAGTDPVELGAGNNGGLRFVGRVYGAQVRDGIDGTVVADPDFTGPDTDLTQFTDSAGRVWTVHDGAIRVDPGTRFRGAVAEWLPAWPYGDISDNDTVDGDPGESTVSVTAAGVLRRLEQGTKTLRSPLHRGLTDFSIVTPVAYWPCEDGEDSTQIASALGAAPMTTAANVKFAAYDGFVASEAIPQFTTGGATGRIPLVAPTGELRVFCTFRVPDNGVPDVAELLSFRTNGAAARWAMELNANDGTMRMRAWDQDGSQLVTSGFIGFDLNGKKLLGGIWLVQNGPQIDWQLFVFEEGSDVGGVFDGTVTSPSFRSVTSVTIGGSGDLADTAVGHVAVFNQDTSTVIWDTATTLLRAWAGETAGARMLRLCREEDVPLLLTGDSAHTQQVGEQRPDTLVNLLREAADVDAGILYEPAGRRGLAYRTHATLYNQTPALALDANSPPGGDIVNPFAPALDDQAARNDVTVSRRGGSSARVTDEDDIAARGRYAEQIQLNTVRDSQLEPIAAWRLHLGTWPGMRYPSVSPAINVNQSQLLPQWLTADLGDLIHVTHLPPQHPTDAVPLLMQGYTESWLPYRVDATANTTPAGPYTALVLDDDQLGRLDSDDTVLAAPVDAGTDATLVADVTTGPGADWTTDPAEYPFDLQAAGVVLTATAAAVTPINVNPDFEVNTTGWAGAGGALSHSTAQAHTGTGSGLLTPDGVTAINRVVVPVSLSPNIYPGRTYQLSVWVYSALGRDVDLFIQWLDAFDNPITFDVPLAIVPVPAATWTHIAASDRAPYQARTGRPHINQRDTPSTSDLLYVDDAALTGHRTTFTIDQTPVNGITTTIPVGEHVRLADPVYLSL